MLTTEHYPQANSDWEDRYEEENSWDHWKTCYKKAHAKARVKAQAAEGANKFGAPNSAKRELEVGFEKSSIETTEGSNNRVGLKALEGYFDNLAAAATNEKIVLEQLVASNANLDATNEELVAVVKNLTKENNYL